MVGLEVGILKTDANLTPLSHSRSRYRTNLNIFLFFSWYNQEGNPVNVRISFEICVGSV